MGEEVRTGNAQRQKRSKKKRRRKNKSAQNATDTTNQKGAPDKLLPSPNSDKSPTSKKPTNKQHPKIAQKAKTTVRQKQHEKKQLPASTQGAIIAKTKKGMRQTRSKNSKNQPKQKISGNTTAKKAKEQPVMTRRDKKMLSRMQRRCCWLIPRANIVLCVEGSTRNFPRLHQMPPRRSRRSRRSSRRSIRRAPGLHIESGYIAANRKAAGSKKANRKERRLQSLQRKHRILPFPSIPGSKRECMERGSLALGLPARRAMRISQWQKPGSKRKLHNDASRKKARKSGMRLVNYLPKSAGTAVRGGTAVLHVDKKMYGDVQKCQAMIRREARRKNERAKWVRLPKSPFSFYEACVLEKSKKLIKRVESQRRNTKKNKAYRKSGSSQRRYSAPSVTRPARKKPMKSGPVTVSSSLAVKWIRVRLKSIRRLPEPKPSGPDHSKRKQGKKMKAKRN